MIREQRLPRATEYAWPRQRTGAEAAVGRRPGASLAAGYMGHGGIERLRGFCHISIAMQQ